MGKDSISWTERVFCSSIIDFILIRINVPSKKHVFSYLNGYCSLMFLSMFFIKVKKHVFNVFLILKLMFLSSVVDW